MEVRGSSGGSGYYQGKGNNWGKPGYQQGFSRPPHSNHVTNPEIQEFLQERRAEKAQKEKTELQQTIKEQSQAAVQQAMAQTPGYQAFLQETQQRNASSSATANPFASSVPHPGFADVPNPMQVFSAMKYWTKQARNLFRRDSDESNAGDARDRSRSKGPSADGSHPSSSASPTPSSPRGVQSPLSQSSSPQHMFTAEQVHTIMQEITKKQAESSSRATSSSNLRKRPAAAPVLLPVDDDDDDEEEDEEPNEADFDSVQKVAKLLKVPITQTQYDEGEWFAHISSTAEWEHMRKLLKKNNLSKARDRKIGLRHLVRHILGNPDWHE